MNSRSKFDIQLSFRIDINRYSSMRNEIDATSFSCHCCANLLASTEEIIKYSFPPDYIFQTIYAQGGMWTHALFQLHEKFKQLLAIAQLCGVFLLLRSATDAS